MCVVCVCAWLHVCVCVFLSVASAAPLGINRVDLGNGKLRLRVTPVLAQVHPVGHSQSYNRTQDLRLPPATAAISPKSDG